MNDYRDWWQKASLIIKAWWSKSLGLILAGVILFVFGTVWENKQITEDCRFMGVFRDGPQAYNCQPRVR